MIFSIRQLLNSVTLICLALTFSQLSPIFGVVALLIGIGVGYFSLEPFKWSVLTCSALFGVGIYVLVFVSGSEFLAPTETSQAVKASTEHRTWVAATKPLLHHTSVPFGALLGFAWGFGYLRLHKRLQWQATPLHRYWFFTALIISALGITGAVDYSFDHSYRMGNLMVFEFAGAQSIKYPPAPDRFFAVHLTNHYMAISVPLMMVLGLASTAVCLILVLRGRNQILSDDLNDPPLVET